MTFRQGDVCWADLGEPAGSGPGYRRPVVIFQNDAFNRSRIATVVVCLLTTNLRRAGSPGNVLLAGREANLPRRTVVNVTQVATIDKSALSGRIGSLSAGRLRQVLEGLYLLLSPVEMGRR